MALPREHFRAVEAEGLDADQDLAGPWHWNGPVLDLQRIRTTGRMKDYCFHRHRLDPDADSVLLRESELLHEILAVPEQPFVIHSPVRVPMPDSHHAEREMISSGRNRLPVSNRHRLREGSRHHAGRGRPGT